MMLKRETIRPSIDPVTPGRALRGCVRRALSMRRGRLHAVMVTAGLATAIPLAQGAAFPPVVPLSSLYPAGGGDGSLGFVLTGVDAYDFSGTSVSAAGDVNADGINDLLVGADNADPRRDLNTCESYVVFGSTQGCPAIFPLASLYPAGGGDGSRGFVLTGIDEGDASGVSVSAAGDVNGDGIEDLFIGASRADPGGDRAGESYVVFGRVAAP